jgi:hypothetical protein
VARREHSLRVRIAAGVTAVLMLAGVGLALLPRDDGGNDTSSTSTAPTTAVTEGPPAPEGTTSTTVADADFERLASGISDLIAAADAQRCPLISAYNGFGELPAPANPGQVRRAVEVTTQLLRATAAAMAEDEAQDAATISATAEALEAEAEAEQYDPDWLNTPPGTRALADPGFAAAVEAYQQRTEELCLPDAGAATPPEGGEGSG